MLYKVVFVNKKDEGQDRFDAWETVASVLERMRAENVVVLRADEDCRRMGDMRDVLVYERRPRCREERRGNGINRVKGVFE